MQKLEWHEVNVYRGEGLLVIQMAHAWHAYAADSCGIYYPASPAEGADPIVGPTPQAAMDAVPPGSNRIEWQQGIVFRSGAVMVMQDEEAWYPYIHHDDAWFPYAEGFGFPGPDEAMAEAEAYRATESETFKRKED